MKSESDSNLDLNLYSSKSGSKPLGSSPTTQANPAADKEKGFSLVKRESLASDEFRLTCLSAVSDHSYPVHLSLETFRHDDCPEYEAVSYTWGGENGDSNLSRPVYIGAFWDVLLQTEHCWEMLRFVRPWRGT